MTFSEAAYATRPVRIGTFGTEAMLAFIAVSLMACAALVVVIWRSRPDSVGSDAPASGPPRIVPATMNGRDLRSRSSVESAMRAKSCRWCSMVRPA